MLGVCSFGFGRPGVPVLSQSLDRQPAITLASSSGCFEVFRSWWQACIGVWRCVDGAWWMLAQGGGT